MYITPQYAGARYRHFNQLIFDGKLPAGMKFGVTRSARSLGLFCVKQRRMSDGMEMPLEVSIRLNTVVDLSESDWDNVLVHEMIHCYIYHCRIGDTSAHGRKFREIMERINREFGMNISVRYDTLPKDVLERALIKRGLKERLIFVFRRRGYDNMYCMKVISMQSCHSASQIAALINQSKELYDLKLYRSKDVYFNRFPCNARSNRFYMVKASDIEPHLPEECVAL